MYPLTTKLPDDLAEAFKASAAEHGVTPSRLARDLVEAFVADPNGRTAGDVESEVRKDIAALVTQHPMGEALAAMAINLARSLDSGAGMAVAAVNRELRETLADLAEQEVGGGDDDEFASGLSAPMGDAEDDI